MSKRSVRVRSLVAALVLLGMAASTACGREGESLGLVTEPGRASTIDLSGRRDLFTLAEADDGRLAVIDGFADAKGETAIWERDASGAWSGPTRLPFALLVPRAWFHDESLVVGGHPCSSPRIAAIEAGDVALDACEEDSPYTIGTVESDGGWKPLADIPASRPGTVRSVLGADGQMWLSHQPEARSDRTVEFFHVDMSDGDVLVPVPGSRPVATELLTRFCGGAPPLWIEERFDGEEGVMSIEVVMRITRDGPRPVTWPGPPAENSMIVCEGGEVRAIAGSDVDAAGGGQATRHDRLIVDGDVATWEAVEQPRGPEGAVFRTYSGRPGTVAFVPVGLGEEGETYSVEVQRDGRWVSVGEVMTGGIIMEVGRGEGAVVVLYSSSAGFSLREFSR